MKLPEMPERPETPKMPKMPPTALVTRVALPSDAIALENACGTVCRLVDHFRDRFARGALRGWVAVQGDLVVGGIVGEVKPPATQAEGEEGAGVARRPESGAAAETETETEAILPEFRLVFVAVAPPWRGRGVGAMLVRAMVEDLRGEKFGSVTVVLPRNYQKGVEFLERVNFRRVGVARGTTTLALDLWENYGVVEEDPYDEGPVEDSDLDLDSAPDSG
ncbi:MAG: hypothetical protein Kow0069_01850 [Promethearchaeota archaeon]